MGWDARHWWMPLSEAVFSGVPLYVGSAIDNKPPLFEFLNLIIAATGHYSLIFLVVIGVVNGIVAGLVGTWVKRNYNLIAGVLAGLLYMSVLPVIDGYQIGVRQFGIVGILYAMCASKPAKNGIGLAIGGLFTQYVTLAIPVFMYKMYNDGSVELRMHYIRFLSSGLATALFGYIIVGIIWGRRSVVNALMNTYMIGPVYFLTIESQRFMTTGGQKFSPFFDLPFYISQLLEVILSIPHIVIPACLFVLMQRNSVNERSKDHMLIGITITMLLPLLARSFLSYWLYSAPFLSAMSAISINRLINDNIDMINIV
jgi:hypothetical protein